jgi:hypothetical protein
VDGDKGDMEEAGREVASKGSSPFSSSSLKSNGEFTESSESGNKIRAELESSPAKVGERERPEWNESSLLTDERRLLASGIATGMNAGNKQYRSHDLRPPFYSLRPKHKVNFGRNSPSCWLALIPSIRT